ncbi:MAG: hypothetical protein JWO35_723 [Candidatus Saccharibacteria bacterium]|nr:hypothetical protein [Candidatus Saccharibacteria bacterium]
MLNSAQKQAVDTIDGPLLVVAGPGTGKTQLLSTRAAKIVASGNVSASNILCLTFTETGAAEMRARLGRVMGPAGGEVFVHTFHSFGTWLIGQYPEYFSSLRALQPLDDLGRYRIFESLLSKLPLRHQLAVRGDDEQFIRRHAVEEAIRAFKQGGLSPDQLRAVVKDNMASFVTIQPLLDEIFGTTLSAKRLGDIAKLVQDAAEKADAGSLATILLHSLATAVAQSQELGRTTPLGKWRDSHTTFKNKQRVLKSNAQAALLSDVIKLYEAYQECLQVEGRFDYEDMVLWAVDALEQKDDLRLDIAERFQYIMVDEYQDTNGAQNRLLDAILQANPLNSPNVMVVGDDDQAVMRFQGAELSGMLAFVAKYEPRIIVLKDNYRSSQPILDASRQIMTQTEERLEAALPEQGFTKQLTAQADRPKSSLEHRIYASPSAEYASVAEHVQELIKQGVEPAEIAIIGRKHAELAEFVPFLTARGISCDYDYRENVLDHPHIAQLLQLAAYIGALGQESKQAELLLPSVLAGDYWQLSATATYELAANARQNKASWLDTMLASSDERWQAIAEWLIAAANITHTHNFTQLLDVLIGREPLAGTELGRSPFAVYLEHEPAQSYITLLSHLICLRSAVLTARPTASGVQDLIDVATEYRQSGLRLIDTNPVLRGDTEGVQVMSAHGSKGREFEHVIILSAIDTIWGSRARGQTQRVRLPENLPLYPAGDADSDRLRLLYVAMTRAKSHLLITSYDNTDGGKKASALSYLQLGEQADAWWQGTPQDVAEDSVKATLETAWRPAPTTIDRSLQQVLQPLLGKYRLSASALRTFIDIRYGGPRASIEQSVLKFPSPYNARSALGSAAHRALEAACAAHKAGAPLSNAQLLKDFDRELDASGLTDIELRAVREHGHQFLPMFVDKFAVSDFDRITSSEQYVTAELPNSSIPLSGAVDALAETKQGIEVIDYKTGKPPLPDWKTTGLSDSKKTSQHFYRQQLLFYKLLIDNSTAFKQHVTAGELVFVEPSEDGDNQFIRLRIDDFDKAELDRTERLIKAVYNCIITAQLPDISGYSQDLKGILAFEADLLGE